MGTTAQKLEYLGTTKSQLKDMINYGLDENKITSSTTFREYVSSIKEAFLESLRNPDTLFTNLPKKSGSGSNITLNDTANAPMRIELGASELSQASTPTPSSPQDIHTISGDNTIRVQNSNLFDIYNLQSGTWGSVNGTYFAYGSRACTINKIKVKPNQKYIISNNNTSTYTIRNIVDGYKLDGTFIGRITGVNGELNGTTFTTPANVEYINITLNETSDTMTWANYQSYLSNGTIKPQLNVGETLLPYEPYISQEAEIDLGYENKLVYPYNNNNAVYTNNGITYTQLGDGRIKINGTSTSTSSFLLRQSNASIPSGDYTAKLFNGILNDCYLVIGGSNSSTTYSASIFRNFSVSNNDCGHFMIQIPSGKTFNNLIVSPMLVKGTYNDIPSFTPYGGKIQYCKIGNYEDKFIRTSGKNLFDANVIQERTHNGITMTFNGQTIHLQGTTTGNANFYLKSGSSISLKAGTYFITRSNISPANLALFSNNVAIVSLGNTDISFTLNQDTIIDGLTLQVPSGAGTINKDITIMLNKGTTALPYEPYGSNEWYIKKNIGKVVLDGTEDYVKRSDIPNLTNTSCFRTSVNANINANAIPNVQQMCDKFICLNNTNDTEHIRYTGAENYRFQIFIDKTRLGSDDASGMKTWATNNNMIIYYPIIPTYTQITGTLAEQLENVYQKLLSYSGTTNISQINNDLPFIMNVSAIEV